MAKNRQRPSSWPKGKWSQQAKEVLAERYLRKDKKGRVIETPDEMCFRVAKTMASIEKNFGVGEKEIEKATRLFYEAFVRHDFLPNSPTLMNAGVGNDHLQYSACFVLPVDDSLESIFDAVKKAALIHKSGGGTGFSFSRLRPQGSIVHSTRGVASGPVSFMRVFDAATNEIKQGGRRRGANMGILRVDHPDILEFIVCKEEGGITNFNLSVAATDRFMKAVLEDKDYSLIDPHTGKRVGKQRARQVFGKIVEEAWKTGDPGLFFIDRANAGPANPVPSMGPLESTNPCGEQPLYPNESCNLGSINLVNFLKKNDFDWEALRGVVRLAVRFLDDVVEANPYPLEEVRQATLLNRRIGLGVMGWADALFSLEIPYESREAQKLAERLMRFIHNEAHFESRNLAKVRGPFPNFSKSIYKNGPALRNATLTTIAPTGSISIIAGASSGIEPAFALAFKHKANGRELTFVNPYFLAAAKKYRLSAKQIREVEEAGVLGEIKNLPAKLRKVFATAHEISPEGHIRMQAAFQKGVDNAVSKTVNLRHDVGVEEVEKAYLLAYKLGCLGITVFRDGCRSEQVLYAGVKPDSAQKVSPATPLLVKERPRKVVGATYRVETPVGTAFVTINANGDNQPLEVFVNVGKAGSDIAADAEAIGRLISLNLRIASSFSPQEVLAQVIDQLEGIGGSQSVGFGKKKVRSLADGIAQVLNEYLGKEEKEVAPVGEQAPLFAKSGKRDLCPSCGRASLIYEEGCHKCLYCGYSKC